MGNPYYIPRDNTRFQNFLGMAGLATQLYGLKQRGDIAEEENLLKGQELTQRGATADRTAGIQEEENRLKGLQVQNEGAKIPEHQKNFGYGDKTLAAIAFKQLGLKDDNPVLQRISELAADKNITKGAAYQSLRNDEEMQQATLDAFQKKMEAAAAKDPNYIQSPQGQKDYQIMQQISTPEGWGKAVDMAMAPTARSMQTEEQNSKAALLEQRLAGQEALQTERLSMQDKINQERLTASEKVNEARLVAAEDRTKTRIDSANELGRLRFQTQAEIAAANNKTKEAIAETKANKGPTAAETRATAKSIADAEEKLISNKSSDAAAGQADYFNQYAQKPYAYAWKPGKLYGGEWSKIQLPKIKGVQVTAAHVYEKAAQDGTTYEEVLKSIGALK